MVPTVLDVDCRETECKPTWGRRQLAYKWEQKLTRATTQENMQTISSRVKLLSQKRLVPQESGLWNGKRKGCCLSALMHDRKNANSLVHTFWNTY